MKTSGATPSHRQSSNIPSASQSSACATMRIVHNDEVCEVSADDFWSLRMDTGFDRFIAEGDKQIWSLLSEAEEPAGADGVVAMRRHTKLNFKENPVPSWLRGALVPLSPPPLRWKAEPGSETLAVIGLATPVVVRAGAGADAAEVEAQRR